MPNGYTTGTRRRSPLSERFWSKVRRSPGCWLWTAGRSSSGYGSLCGKRAHRIAWELTYGPIPEGMMACHKCDNKLCVRPDHLFLGTHRDNMADRAAKGRAATGARNAAHLYPELVRRGEEHGRAKLTEDDVREIRRRREAGEQLGSLALAFGVSFGMISQIARRTAWRHVA